MTIWAVTSPVCSWRIALIWSAVWRRRPSLGFACHLAGRDPPIQTGLDCRVAMAVESGTLLAIEDETRLGAKPCSGISKWPGMDGDDIG
jgi:hypothetical protein